MNVGNNIKKYRMKCHLSQEQLAQQLFVTRQTISNYETGKSEPDLQTLTQLDQIFGCGLEELIEGKTTKPDLKRDILGLFILIIVGFSLFCLADYQQRFFRLFSVILFFPIILTASSFLFVRIIKKSYSFKVDVYASFFAKIVFGLWLIYLGIILIEYRHVSLLNITSEYLLVGEYRLFYTLHYFFRTYPILYIPFLLAGFYLACGFEKNNEGFSTNHWIVKIINRLGIVILLIGVGFTVNFYFRFNNFRDFKNQVNNVVTVEKLSEWYEDVDIFVSESGETSNSSSHEINYYTSFNTNEPVTIENWMLNAIYEITNTKTNLNGEITYYLNNIENADFSKTKNDTELYVFYLPYDNLSALFGCHHCLEYDVYFLSKIEGTVDDLDLVYETGQNLFLGLE